MAGQKVDRYDSSKYVSNAIIAQSDAECADFGIDFAGIWNKMCIFAHELMETNQLFRYEIKRTNKQN